jgi:hypothetical protein
VLKQRLADAAPEQLPDKALALDGGAQEAAAAAVAGGSGRKGSDTAAAAAGLAGAAQLLLDADDDSDDDDVDDVDDDGDDGVPAVLTPAASGASPAAAAAGAAPSAAAEGARAAAELDEMCLSGLPWEFTISRDALVAWMRLDRCVARCALLVDSPCDYRRLCSVNGPAMAASGAGCQAAIAHLFMPCTPCACRPLAQLVALRLRQIGGGNWGRGGTTKRLATSEPGLELWRTKVTRGGRIIFQVPVVSGVTVAALHMVSRRRSAAL